MGRHPVHEVPIVRDKQQCTRIAGQPVLQPQAGIQIQVVGGFVQQQQIRRLHQRLGQIQPDSPATGKRGHRVIGITVHKAQPANQGLRSPGSGPCLMHIQLAVDPRHGVVVTRGLCRRQRRFQLPQACVAIQHKIPCAARGRLHFLCHMGNATAAGQVHTALLRAQLSQQQLEQTGLSRAVGADNGDTLAGLNGDAGGL
jgi:hypothetical protein